MKTSHHLVKRILLVLLILILLGAMGYGVYRYLETRKELASTQTTLDALNAEYAQKKAEFDANTTASENENNALQEAIRANEKKLLSYEQQISDFSNTVGIFQKLQTLDPELLQKYSKVYFLNENYTPTALTTIPAEYVNGKGRVLTINTNVWPFLHQLLIDSTENNLHILVSSAYRSFKDQQSLKSSYTVTYGLGANKFSADQGYSEHQLGTTVDLTTTSTGDLSQKFETTVEFKWMQENAYKYGFTLSYPKNNSYYVYEPWHWRFVGIALATKLHEENKYLYNLDQREIDGYLLTIFDPAS